MKVMKCFLVLSFLVTATVAMGARADDLNDAHERCMGERGPRNVYYPGFEGCIPIEQKWMQRRLETVKQAPPGVPPQDKDEDAKAFIAKTNNEFK